jgi:hypothetical protein
MTLDMALAKPAAPPSSIVGGAVATTVEGHLAAQLPNDIALGDLGRHGSNYGGPGGILLNAGYIDYLRALLPARRVRLRMKTNAEPVVIVLDGKAVGLIMPMRSTS